MSAAVVRPTRLQGPPRIRGPRVVHTARLLRAPLGTYGAWQRRHGDTFVVPAINGDVVVTGDPAVIRDLFRADTREVEPFGAAAAAPLVGVRSLLLLKGEPHRRERKLLMPPFHGPRMRSYGELIREIAERRLAVIPPGSPFVAADAMLDISLQVIVQAVFGVRGAERVGRWASAVGAVVGAFHPALLFAPWLQRSVFPPWRRFLAARAALDDLLFQEIADRRASGAGGDDILSLMLDAAYEDGRPMADDAVRDELVTLLFAGHETTQISMAWALYRLCRAPGPLARLIAELDATDGSPEQLAAAPYLDAVVQETLRMDPVVPDMVRTLTVDLPLGPWSFPAGTHVSPAAALVHVRPDLYPEPTQFRPERWLGERPRPWEFVPFGGGVRRCIGAALATYEMKVVVGTWIRGAELRSERTDVPVRRNITLGPRHGVPMRLVRRRGAPDRSR